MSGTDPVRIRWTRHAEERQQSWARLIGITRSDVEKIVASPDQIVDGDLGALVAQARRANGLLRVVYVEEGQERRILTLYWTSRVDRYWRE